MKKGLISEMRRMRELMGRLCEGVNDHDVLDKVWISYGTSAFDPEKFKTYDDAFSRDEYENKFVNAGWGDRMSYGDFIELQRRTMGNKNKPLFGLWASPVDSKWGWRNFCMSERFGLDKLKDKFLFKLSPNSKIYVIDNVEDLDAVSVSGLDDVGYKTIDFRKLLDDGFDGIYVTENAVGLYDDSNTMLRGLELWDVESICVFNKDVVIPIGDESLFPDDSELESLQDEDDMDMGDWDENYWDDEF